MISGNDVGDIAEGVAQACVEKKYKLKAMTKKYRSVKGN